MSIAIMLRKITEDDIGHNIRIKIRIDHDMFTCEWISWMIGDDNDDSEDIRRYGVTIRWNDVHWNDDETNLNWEEDDASDDEYVYLYYYYYNIYNIII